MKNNFFYLLLAVRISSCFSSDNSFINSFKLQLISTTSLNYTFQKQKSLYKDSPQEQEPFSMENFVYGEKFSSNLLLVNSFSKPENNSCTYGFCLFSDKYFPVWPCTLKFGNLSPGGSFSRLKNPLLTSSGPFSVNSTSVKFLTTSLPSTNSFNKPLSSFVQAGYCNKKSIFQEAKINCFYTPANIPVLSDFCFSGFLRIVPLKKWKVDFAVTGGLFPLEENTFSSWFTTSKPYFHKQDILAFNSNFSLSIKDFSTLFTILSFQSPFGSFDYLYRSESVFKIKHSAFSLSFLYNPVQNLTILENQNIDQTFQLKTSFQKEFLRPSRKNPDNPFMCKSGFSCLHSYNYDNDKTSINMALGLKCLNQNFSLTAKTFLNAEFSNSSINASDYTKTIPSLDVTLKSIKIEVNNVYFTKPVKPEFIFSLSIKPTSDYSYITYIHSYGVNLSIYKNGLFSIPGTLTITEKNISDEKKIDFKTGLQGDFSFRKISCSVKITFDLSSDS